MPINKILELGTKIAGVQNRVDQVMRCQRWVVVDDDRVAWTLDTVRDGVGDVRGQRETWKTGWIFMDGGRSSSTVTGPKTRLMVKGPILRDESLGQGRAEGMLEVDNQTRSPTE